MGVYRPWLIGFLSYSTVDKVGQEHDNIRQKYKYQHFQEYCCKERQRFFCIFIDRALDDRADRVDGGTDGRSEDTHGDDRCHQNAEVNRIKADFLHHRQEDRREEKEVDVAVKEHTEDEQPDKDDYHEQLRLAGNAEDEVCQSLRQTAICNGIAEGAGHSDEQHNGGSIHNRSSKARPKLLPSQFLVNKHADDYCVNDAVGTGFRGMPTIRITGKMSAHIEPLKLIQNSRSVRRFASFWGGS